MKFKEIICSIIVIVFLSFINFLYSINLMAGENNISGGAADKNINSDEEDYGAFIIYGLDNDTLFFTSSRPVESRRKIAITAEMFYSIRPAKDRYIMKINEGWSKANQFFAKSSKIAEISRGALAFDNTRSKVIFAAERDLTNDKARGSSYLFDLYEMSKELTGYSEPKPLNEVNEPDYWDSQPALSPDGKMLFFVSNREGGSGGLDIWYSFKDYRGKWSKPLIVPKINTPGDEYSPHFGSDGFFYFSSNWNYKDSGLGKTGKDIYRAEYEKVNGFSLPANPVLLDDAIASDAAKYGLDIPTDIKYNSDKDDEFPYITDDRKAIFITSNRKANFEKRNIFAFSLPKSRIRLQVNVSETILDANGNIVKASTQKSGLNLTLVDKATSTTKDITSGTPYEVDVDKEYFIQFSKFVEEECYSNKIEGPKDLVVKTFQPFSRDTLFLESVSITRQKVEIPPIIFNSTDTLPYFITGYWYPNTSENINEFRKREGGGFFNNTGFVDSTGYNYEDIRKKIDQSFTKDIYEPLEELLPTFQDFCRDTLYLKVTVHGYTDPRGLSGGEEHPYRPQSKYQRNYPDESIIVGIDERGQEVKIPTGINMWNYNWPVNPDDKEGRWIKLSDEGEKGNILLSKLRAHYTFVTFDRAMRARSPIYEQLRNNGRVILDAEGFGIDKEGFKERGLRDDPQSRRIEIYLDILRPEEISTHKRLAGGKLKIVKTQDITNLSNGNSLKEKSNKPDNQTDLNKVEPDKEEKVTEANPESIKNEDAAPVEQVKSDDEVKKEVAPEIKQILDEETKSEPVPEFEKEDEYTDEEDLAEKYQKVDEKPIVQPLQPASGNERILRADAERFCYKIYYQSYDNSQDAFKSKQILSAAGIEDVRVVEVLDNFGGNRTYELYSGCYDGTAEAIDAMKKVGWAAEALKLSRKPVIIR